MNKTVFTYWEGTDYKLLKQLQKLMIDHSNNGLNYNLILLTDKNIKDYVDEFPKCFLNLEPAHKTDYLRVYLIRKYGGLWIDADTLVMNDLSVLFKIIEKNNAFFVTEHQGTICNGVFGSKSNTPLLNNWLDYINDYLEKNNQVSWTAIGADYLTNKKKFIMDHHTLLDGPRTIFPISWKDAVTEFSSNKLVSEIDTGFMPLVILVNPVYKSYEYSDYSNSLLEKLINQSRKNVLLKFLPKMYL